MRMMGQSPVRDACALDSIVALRNVSNRHPEHAACGQFERHGIELVGILAVFYEPSCDQAVNLCRGNLLILHMFLTNMDLLKEAVSLSPNVTAVTHHTPAHGPTLQIVTSETP